MLRLFGQQARICNVRGRVWREKGLSRVNKRCAKLLNAGSFSEATNGRLGSRRLVTVLACLFLPSPRLTCCAIATPKIQAFGWGAVRSCSNHYYWYHDSQSGVCLHGMFILGLPGCFASSVVSAFRFLGLVGRLRLLILSGDSVAGISSGVGAMHASRAYLHSPGGA